MTHATLAAVNYLLQQPDVVAVVGSDDELGPWIFDEKIERIVEGSSRAAIVITEDGWWAAPNDHNSMRFPRLTVDVWADVTRAADQTTVLRSNARTRAEDVHAAVRRHFHFKNLGKTWGTAEEIAEGHGVLVIGSVGGGSPQVREIADGDGAVMDSRAYDLTLP